MDPFEARLQFIQLLTTLNPSHQAIQKVISYALKNYELHEDFHSVILEKLDQLDLNARMNVLFLIEGLINSVFIEFGNKQEDGPKPYVANFYKDFYQILEKIIVIENLVNLNSASVILRNIENCYIKNHFDGTETSNTELIGKYETLNIDNLKKEFNSNEIVAEKIDKATKVFEKCWLFLILMKRNSLISRFNQINNIETKGDMSLTTLNRDQISNRMESDRERHKRFKESNWIINRMTSKIDNEEFNKIWDQYDELNEDDYQDLKEMNEIVKESYQI